MDRPGPSVVPEGVVIGRMPVSSRNDEPCLASEAVDRLNNGITVRNGERAAGTKVVLDIDDDQGIHNPEYSPGMAQPTGVKAMREELAQVLLAPADAIAISVHGRTEAAVLVPLYTEAGEIHVVFTKRHDELRRH